MSDEPTVTNVWNEITISGEGIGITLYSESAGIGAVVEDETWYTFDELQLLTGDIINLNLSHETRERLSDDESWSAPSTDEVMESAGRQSAHSQQSVDLQVGDLVIDTNGPDWANQYGAQVVGISDKSASEYIVQERPYKGDKTVHDANPSCHPDEPVVKAVYLNDEGIPTKDEYAFPASRLERKD